MGQLCHVKAGHCRIPEGGVLLFFFFVSSAIHCLPGVRTLRLQGQGPGRLGGDPRYLEGYHGKMPQQCDLDDSLGWFKSVSEVGFRQSLGLSDYRNRHVKIVIV